MAPDGAGAVVIARRGASVLRLTGDLAILSTLAGVESAALLPGGRLAGPRAELRIGALSDLEGASSAAAFGARISALAADREGALAPTAACWRSARAAPRAGSSASRPCGSPSRRATRGWPPPTRQAGRMSSTCAAAHTARSSPGTGSTMPSSSPMRSWSSPLPSGIPPRSRSRSPHRIPPAGRGSIRAALGAAPGAPMAAVAMGGELFLASARRAGDSVSDAERLVHRR